MPTAKIIDSLVNALMNLAGLPPEAGTPERTDAPIARPDVIDLEQQVATRTWIAERSAATSGRVVATPLGRWRPGGVSASVDGVREASLGVAGPADCPDAG